MSAPEIVKLTRIGRFNMDGTQRSPLDFLKKLRGGGKGKPPSVGAKQMAMLRRIPRILRFIPGAAQDVRAYFLTLQYLLAGSDDNVANLVRFLIGRYADGHAHRRGGADQGAAARRIPRSRRVSPAHGRPHRGDRRQAAAPVRTGKGPRRPAGDALLPAGRQHRALRRRASPRSRRAASRSSRPSRAGSTRVRRSSSSSCGTAARRRRDRLADRLLAGRRPRLQRRAGGRGNAGRARRALHRRAGARIPDAGAVGSIRPRPDAGRGHHDGRDPGARRRDLAHRVRRPLGRGAGRRATCRPRATCGCIPSAPMPWPRSWTRSSRCGARRAPSAGSPSSSSTSRRMPARRARRPTSRCSPRCSTR